MKLPEDGEPIFAALDAVQRLLERFDGKGVIIGGVAASLLGKPRFTEDLDAMILLSVKDIPHLLDAAREEGIEPRHSDTLEFGRKNRVLLLRHTPSETDIDISLGVLPFEEEMVERSITRPVMSLSIRLPTPEDLIIMKAIAHRHKDLDDIISIAQKNPGLDLDRIETWVKAFAEVLELPNLWNDIRRVLDEAG